MKIEKYLPHLVTLVLLTLAGVFKSSAFAAASVVGVLGIVAESYLRDRLIALTPKPASVDEATKRALQDLNARVATLEYGVKQRGF